jgi:hypothetical protein
MKKPGRRFGPAWDLRTSCEKKWRDVKLRAGIRSEYQPEGEGSESLLQDLPYLGWIIRSAPCPTISNGLIFL